MNRMERLVILHFSAGCISESSVAVSVQQPKRSKPHTKSSASGTREEEEEESISSGSSMKSSLRFLTLPKPNISIGFSRVFKSFKTFSQLFVYKEDPDEEETEMEIGLPTEVKHVTHIGADGSTITNPGVKGWGNLVAPEFLPPPLPLSLTQFELAMAARPDSNTPHDDDGSS